MCEITETIWQRRAGDVRSDPRVDGAIQPAREGGEEAAHHAHFLMLREATDAPML